MPPKKAGTKKPRGKKKSALDDPPTDSDSPGGVAGSGAGSGSAAPADEPDGAAAPASTAAAAAAATAAAAKAAPAVWTDEQEDYLLELLVQQLPAKSGGGWRDPIWQTVARQMQEKFPNAPGGKKDAQKCRDKFTKLKSTYSVLYKMRGLSGFGWCAVRHIVTATDSVWDDYVKAHPKHAKWRNTSFPLYDRLALLSGNSIANGKGVVRLGAGAADSDSSSSPGASEDEEETADAGEEDTANNLASQNATPAPKRTVSDPAVSQPRKKQRQDNRRSSAGGMFAMASSIEKLGAAWAAPSSSLQPSPVRVKAAIAAVEADEELDDDDLVAIVTLFSGEGGTRKADAYTAITRKGARTAYLRKLIE